MKALATILAGLVVATAFASPTATLTLSSPQNLTNVQPGATVDWTISVQVSSGDNAGLALICVDMEQSLANPVKFDLPPGSTIPPNMAKFRRALGISNPDENSLPGYAGVQRGTAGQKQLRQIGGGQNTFGAPGGTIGTDPNPLGGVGQGSPRVVLSGSFTAPAAAGQYTFQLTNPLVNVMTSLGTPPAFSPVVAVATSDINMANAAITFTVSSGPQPCPGDLNCDGTVDFADIDPFVLALSGEQAYLAQFPNCRWLNGDANGDNTVDFADIDAFVGLLFTPCP